ncbi:MULTISPECIES: N-acetylmuramoyl-L-alanine amidase [Actinomycetes]|uniref:N-acetylmuramoyl-L-alanine amidase n=1 Tax=Actinomycetes TaxID=1760 RepID=UPI0033CB4F54
MATPLTAPQFAAALRAEGVTVVELPGWESHTRTGAGRPWGPVHGVLVHHTVTRGTAASVDLCRRGYASLPGPLCHAVIAKDGTVHLVGYGRTNHAGGGDPRVLAAVQAESYGTRPPVPAKGNKDGIDGNRHYYGMECVNLGDGKDPWPAAQLEAIERVSAAVCRAHGWSAKSVIGHLEWSDDKVDPRGFTMPDMRARVARRLGTAPAKPPAAKPPSKPKPKPVVDLSLLIAAARRDPARAGTPVSYAGARVVEAALAEEGLLAAGLIDGHFGTATNAAYAGWQRRLGYSGAAADGIPGAASLRKLGSRHGFTITP